MKRESVKEDISTVAALSLPSTLERNRFCSRRTCSDAGGNGTHVNVHTCFSLPTPFSQLYRSFIQI